MRSFGVLIVIDVQRGFDDTRWGRRGNPGCERNVAALIAVWRQRNGTIVFVRHDSQAQESPLYSGSPGNAFKPEIDGEPDLLVVKHVNSAFYGSLDLHAWLQDHGHHALTICGITTNHCCETTARMAGNLGYETTFASTRPTPLTVGPWTGAGSQPKRSHASAQRTSPKSSRP
jgi:nicotinamidase-related amidase